MCMFSSAENQGRLTVHRVSERQPIIAFKQVKVKKCPNLRFQPLFSSNFPVEGWVRGGTYEAHAPISLWSQSKTGFHALTADSIHRAHKQDPYLIISVALWGRVVKYTKGPIKGYRAQYMKVL